MPGIFRNIGHLALIDGSCNVEMQKTGVEETPGLDDFRPVGGHVTLAGQC